MRTLCALLPLLASARARADDDADQARAFHEKAKAAFALSHYTQAAEYFEKAFELKSDPALLYNAAQSHRLAGNKDRALTLYQNYLHVYGRDDRHAQIQMRIDELKKAIEHDRREIPARPPATWPPGTAPPASTGAPGPSGPSPTTSSTGGSFKPAPPSVASAPSKPAPPTSAGAAPPALESPSPSVLAPPPVLASNTPSGSLPSAQPPGPAPQAMLTQPASSSGDEGGSLTSKPWFWIAVGGAVAAAAAAVLLVTLSGSKDPTATFGQAHGN